jgi:hypothetical protein
MANEGCRLLVAVFDLRERAERASAQLLADGHDGDRVLVIDGPDARAGLVAELVAGGVASEAAAYYEGEVGAGRCLLAVSCHPDDARGVLNTFGRHAGSVRIPAEVRDGRA